MSVEMAHELAVAIVWISFFLLINAMHKRKIKEENDDNNKSK